MQVKGVTSEYKSFGSFEEAKAYVLGRRLFMLHRILSKPRSSFVGGKALRAELEIWQDGCADSLRIECALDTMSDVNLARIELLHDVHEVHSDRVKSSAGKTTFTKEGVLKVLYQGEVLCVPALVTTTGQLPASRM